MSTLTIPELEATLAALRLGARLPLHASADVLNQPLDVCRTCLAELLSSIVGCDSGIAYTSIQLSNDPLHGDFTVVLPKLLPGTKPAECAVDLIKKFPPEHSLFSLPWPDGVQLRLCVKAEVLPRLILPFINDRKHEYGIKSRPSELDATAVDEPRKKLVVEFSSPNIASEFQGKHLRSTVIGTFVSTLHERLGWDVTRLNYLGDWGKDIALLGVGWEKFGSEEAFETDPAGHLLDIFHKIHVLFLPEQQASKTARDEAKKKGEDEQEVTAEIESKGVFAERNDFFKRMEEGDEKAVELCKRIRNININDFTQFYARLGTTFDEYSGESQIAHEAMTELENLMREKDLLEESGGAWVIDMKKCGIKTGTAIVRDRTGSSTYLLRYLAAVLERYRKFDFDKMIFVAADRTGHFPRLIKILETLGMEGLAGKLQHVSFNDVSHMVEKLGHGLQPHSILDQCEATMFEALKAKGEKAAVLGNSEQNAKILGITTLIAQELSTKRGNDHAFDLDNMTSFKSGSVADMQFWYTKLVQFLEAHPSDPDISAETYGELIEEDQTSLLLTLGQYPEVIQASFKNLESSTIMSYLQGLAERVEDLLGEDDDENDGEENTKPEDGGEKVEEAEQDTKEEKVITPAEIALYEATRQVMENGMKILGLTPVLNAERLRVDSPVAE